MALTMQQAGSGAPAMNIKQCMQVLRLKQAGSKSDIDQAYREMLDTWRPDRFAAGSLMQIQAEAKITEINQAYHTLIAFFSGRHAKNQLSQPASPYPADSKNHSRYQKSPSPKDDLAIRDNTSLRPSGPLPRTSVGRGGVRPAGTSVSAKYLWAGLLLLLVFVSILIIRYISDIDEKTFKARPQVRVLNRLSSETGSAKKISPVQTTAAQSKPITFRQYKKKPASAASRFEIHLKSGDIILVRQWWEQADMIMYTTKHGTMGGVGESIVEHIVRR